MAHTDIFLKETDGMFMPNHSEVPVITSDTINFSNVGGRQVALFFSPGAVAVLSPTPLTPMVLAPGSNAEFTFTSSDAGAYSVFFERDASAPPAHFRVQPSHVLWLEDDATHAGFSGPNIGTRS